MAYAIRIKTSAVREFRKLGVQDQRRIKTRIDALAANPRPTGARAFVGIKNAYRIRIGDFRVVYRVVDSERVVHIILIGHRKDVYRKR